MVPYWLALSVLWLGIALPAWAVLRRRKADPVAELVVTEPPERLSPAAMRYLFQQSYDNTCLIVSALNAAMHGGYHLTWKQTGFTAQRRPGDASKLLSPEERATFLKDDDQWVEKIYLGEKNDAATLKAEERLFFHLRRNYGKWLFPKNVIFVTISVIITVLVVWTAKQFDPSGESRWHINGLIASLGVALPGLVLSSYHLYVSFHETDQAGWMLTGAILFFGAILLYTEFIAPHGNLLYVAPFAALEAWVLWHLPAYAPGFRKRARAISDFREFLLRRVHTREPFTEAEYPMIPYLVALDVPFDKDTYFEALLNK